MKLSIIVPVYNEQDTIATVLNHILTVKLLWDIDKEIVVVNDGSSDRTGEELKKFDHKDLCVYSLDRNMGKTFAVNYGIQCSSGDIIVIQDADLEYSPDHYPELLEPIINQRTKIVYGSRFLGTIERMTFINRCANLISTWTLNILYGCKLTDMHTCLKLFKKEIFSDINLISNGFCFDTELTCKLVKAKYQIVEKPINYRARSKKEGKKITWINALATYLTLFKYALIKNM